MTLLMVPQWCMKRKQARNVMREVPFAIKLTYLDDLMILVKFWKIQSLILLNSLVLSPSEHDKLLGNSRLEGRFPVCMGCDGNPQVIHSSLESRLDSRDGFGEVSVSGLAQKCLQDCSVVCYI